MTDAMTEFFGEPIYAYTRAQAIADGILVDVTETAQRMGYKFPVAMTSAAYADTVEWTEEDEARKGVFTAQEVEGRLCDVLWMGLLAARRATGRIAEFDVYRVPRETKATQAKPSPLVMHCGPGDTAAPVMTIMVPGED